MMLITFKTKAHANVTMFGDIALKLLELMGRSETVPSAIKPEDIPSALTALEAGVAANDADAKKEKKAKTENNDDQTEDLVSLHNRALPLIELLQAAKKADVHVIWEKGGSIV
jgi:hypothetical protein